MSGQLATDIRAAVDALREIRALEHLRAGGNASHEMYDIAMTVNTDRLLQAADFLDWLGEQVLDVVARRVKP